jgi:CRP-like cAMP-binding protein
MTNTFDIFQKLNLLKEIFKTRTHVSETEVQRALELMQFKQFDKGDCLTEIGKIENYTYFIIEGVTRSFFFKDEKEVSLDFHFTGDLVSVYESFIDRMPAEHALEALTPLSMMRIRHDDLEKLYEEYPNFKLVRTVLVEEQFKKSSQRVKDLLSLSATERYLKLLNLHPEYVQNIPLKYLASYLNITPESLSRIRKSL